MTQSYTKKKLLSRNLPIRGGLIILNPAHFMIYQDAIAFLKSVHRVSFSLNLVKPVLFKKKNSKGDFICIKLILMHFKLF